MFSENPASIEIVSISTIGRRYDRSQTRKDQARRPRSPIAHHMATADCSQTTLPCEQYHMIVPWREEGGTGKGKGPMVPQA
jgi:hypothetical protein